MEHAAFDPQLSSEELQQLGLLTVNFGYIELLLDWLLMSALEVRNTEAARALISPLGISRKTDMLMKALPRCPNVEAASLINNALSKIRSANDDRNNVIHGYWAHKDGVGVTVFKITNPTKTKASATITQISDDAAVASRELYRAWNILNGQSDRDCSLPHILAPQENGKYYVVVRTPEPRAE